MWGLFKVKHRGFKVKANILYQKGKYFCKGGDLILSYPLYVLTRDN